MQIREIQYFAVKDSRINSLFPKKPREIGGGIMNYRLKLAIIVGII
jgi:hypothetical protein